MRDVVIKDYIELISIKPITWSLLEKAILKIENPVEHFSQVDWSLHPLYWLAENCDDTEECSHFIDMVLQMFIKNMNHPNCLFGNSAFLWATSRVTPEKTATAPHFVNTYLHVSVDLYKGVHHQEVYLNKLYQFLVDNDQLTADLYSANTATQFTNTPLLLALKNANTELAIRLVKHYPMSALLHKDGAGNTALHLASFFRMDEVIDAILARATTLQCLEPLLTIRNEHDYTAADCYCADKPEPKTLAQLFSQAESIKIATGIFPLSTVKNTEDDALSIFVTASELINFNSFQECCHPYSSLARGTVNPEIKKQLLHPEVKLKTIDYTHQNVLIKDPRTHTKTSSSTQKKSGNIFKIYSLGKHAENYYQGRIKVDDETLSAICKAFATKYSTLKTCVIYEVYEDNGIYYVGAYLNPTKKDCLKTYRVKLPDEISLYHAFQEKPFQEIESFCGTTFELESTKLELKHPSSSKTEEESRLKEDVSPGANAPATTSTPTKDYTAEHQQLEKQLDKAIAENNRYFKTAIVLSLVGIIAPIISHIIIWSVYSAIRNDITQFEIDKNRYLESKNINDDQFVSNRTRNKPAFKEDGTPRKIIRENSDSIKPTLTFFFLNKNLPKEKIEKYKQLDSENAIKTTISKIGA